MRRVCVVVGSRANYSSIKSALAAIQVHPDLDLQLVAAASAVLDRYGRVADLMTKNGFIPAANLHMLIEGETPSTMAKSTGLGLIELPTILESLNPHIVLTVGDRFETMATTLAAAYMNKHIAHTMGGEVSGNIDESIRHAVTKFAHIHFPASRDAADRIRQLGELPQDIHLVGCPRIDTAAAILRDFKPVEEDILREGVGAQSISFDEPFLLVAQHPVTSEYGQGESQMTETLEAVLNTDLPALVLWPNADAGSEDVSRALRKWRERGLDKNMHFFKNLAPETYLRLMSLAACLIGNSSSGIREGAFLGTPTVDIGSRQSGRERGPNVINVPHDRKKISEAISVQVEHGRYSADHTYGDGNAGRRIASVLATTELPSVQKRLTF